MERVNCIICNKDDTAFLFSKESREGTPFSLVKCKRCDLEFISPRPSPGEIGKYYDLKYFKERTDRGYDDYFSEDLKNEIQRVMNLNLEDLGFFEFEKKLPGKKVLDIGCAAGYFVEFMKERGWDSTGIDISPDCVGFARDKGLDVHLADYLEFNFKEKFDLITLWASIEHLHNPDKFISKIHTDLSDGGMLYISTCRTGALNFMKLSGKNWRFYNFPEHLYFFSYGSIKKLLENNGFYIEKYFTYGSGIGKSGSFIRNISDLFAKRFLLGDMMLISARKL